MVYVTDFDETRHEPRPGRHRPPDDAADATTASGASEPAAPRDGYSTRDGARNEAHDDDFRDDAVVGAGAGAGAGAGGAGGTGGSGAGGGMPLRGLAMVLIFIGVCLMGWGLYAWTSGTDDDAAAGSGDDGVRAEAGQNPANAPAGDPADPAAPAEGDAAPAAPAEGEGRPDAADPDPAAAERDDAAGADDEGVRRGDFRVTVLNNSNVPGLAADVSDDLSGQGWGRGETGNAPEGNVGVFERTTVVYTPGNDAERAAAEEIARDRGWAVEPRGDNLAGKPGGVLVVVTEDAR